MSGYWLSQPRYGRCCVVWHDGQHFDRRQRHGVNSERKQRHVHWTNIAQDKLHITYSRQQNEQMVDVLRDAAAAAAADDDDDDALPTQS